MKRGGVDQLAKELAELKGRTAVLEALVRELVRPRKEYIKELAAKVAAGDKEALKAHNRAQEIRLGLS